MKKPLKDILPTHEPPQQIWDNIAQELSPLKSIPIYEPPQAVWQNIENKLSAKPTMKWWYYAAASVLFLVAGIAIYTNFEDKKSKLTYSVEQYKQPTLSTDTEYINQQYAQIEAICKEKKPICNEPDFKILKAELDQSTVSSNEHRSH